MKNEDDKNSLKKLTLLNLGPSHLVGRESQGFYTLDNLRSLFEKDPLTTVWTLNTWQLAKGFIGYFPIAISICAHKSHKKKKTTNSINFPL